MKYFFVLGVKFQKYKKPCQITVSTGDRFIDTFKLDESTGHCENPLIHVQESEYHANNFLKYLHDARCKKNWMKVGLPKLVKVYSIDESDIGHDIKIQVENTDSDFTNGFMKNSGLISFPYIALFPAHLARDNGKKLMKMIFKWDLDEKLKKGYDVPRWHWPNMAEWQVTFENNIYQEDMIAYENSWVGGSFSVQVPDRRKHHMKVLWTPRKPTPGFPRLASLEALFLGSCKQLLNIYNENQ